MTDVGEQKVENRCQRTDVREQKAEAREQKTEVGGQRCMNVEGGMRNEQSIGQRAWGKVEVGRRNTEFGRWKAEPPSIMCSSRDSSFIAYRRFLVLA